jgi:hypothetical protein
MDHEERLNQVVGREFVLSNQASKRIGAAAAAGPDR